MFSDPPGQNLGECAAPSPSDITGTLNIYLTWANTSGSSWTAGNQALVRTYLNGLAGSSWWALLSAYDAAFASSTMGILEECTLTSNVSPISCTSGIDLSSCGFPSDGQGLYIYLPSDTSISAAEDSHCGFKEPIYSVQIAGSSWPSPNGNPQLDLQLANLAHEVAEYLTDPFGTGGWHCSIGNPGDDEVADLCSPVPGGGWLGSVGGQPYNLTIGSSHYWIQNLWYPGGTPTSPGVTAGTTNGCYAQVPDVAKVGTFGGGPGGCVGSNSFQLAVDTHGWCTVPTCNDGQKDAYETDVDCGGTCPSYNSITGPLAPPGNGMCGSGKRCMYFTDCASGTCNSGACL
jgi:hypothetical protein